MPCYTHKGDRIVTINSGTSLHLYTITDGLGGTSVVIGCVRLSTRPSVSKISFSQQTYDFHFRMCIGHEYGMPGL